MSLDIAKSKTLIYLEARLLKVHDGIRDLDTDRLDGHLYVERSCQPLREAHQRLYIVVPRLVDLVVVGEAALHDVEAEAVARLDVREALTGGTGGHPLERGEAGGRGGHLQD